MPIGPDSPLRRIPARLESRQRLFLDGIRYSAEMTELAYARLCHTAEEATRRVNNEAELGALHSALFLDAWSMVDSIHRLRALVLSLHALDGSAPPQPFLDSTSAFYELRNLSQHLNRRLPGMASRNEPVWGSLSWVTGWPDQPNDCWITMAMAGAVVTTPGRPMVNPLGRTLRGPVDLVELTSRGDSLRPLTVSLTEGIEHLQAYVASLERALAPQFSNEPTLGADIVAVAQLRLG